jgi:hypothetical protein
VNGQGDQPTGPLEERLERERPVPAAGFRGELRRRLIEAAGRETSTARVRFSILAYASSGAALMLVAVIGVLGAGPLAA